MRQARLRRALSAGTATSLGSLPHTHPAVAADVVLSAHPGLPATPELPARDPAEALVARCLDPAPAERRFGGLSTFLDLAAASSPAPAAVKTQVAGPLTLGMALVADGMPVGEAFATGSAMSARAATATADLIHQRLPHADVVMFVDEPALVAWSREDAPLDRETAVDLLSGVLAGIDEIRGVHVCGDGDLRMALEAGPDVLSFEVRDAVLADGVALARFLEAGGWIAWGAVPTDRPVGERPDHWWNALVSLWCDLTRAGCDPVTLRTQALITPACGLAHHSEDQAARILDLCVELGERVREQAIATRLSVGA